MKRRDLEKHLRAHGCELIRHGARHDVWANQNNAGQSAVPRHAEIATPTIRAICKALGIPMP